MIFAHFSMELLIILLLIHKSLSYIEEMDQWFVPSKDLSFFTSNSSLLPLNINFLMLSSTLSLLWLSCMFTFFKWIGNKDKSQACKKLYFWISREHIFCKMDLKPERSFTWHPHQNQRLSFLLVDWWTLGSLLSCSLTIN